MIKRYIILLVICIRLFSTLTVLGDENQFALEVVPSYGNIGGYVDVPVSVSNNAGFAAFTIDIEYDNNILTPIELVKFDLLSGKLVDNLHYSDNRIRVVFANFDNTTGNGKIFFIRFKINEVTVSNTFADIQIMPTFFSNRDLEQLSPAVKNGRVMLLNKGEFPITSEITNTEKVFGGYLIEGNFVNRTDTYFENAVICVAIYNKSQKLLNTRIETITFNANEASKNSIMVYTKNEASVVKLFVWSNTSGLSPYANSVTKIIPSRVATSEDVNLKIIRGGYDIDEGIVNMGFNITNTTFFNIKASVFISVYDLNNRLISTIVKNINLGEAEKAYAFESLAINNLCTNGFVVKISVWDSMMNMMPLSKVVKNVIYFGN